MAYIELSQIYNWTNVSCIKDNNIRTIDDIGNEIMENIIDERI